MLERTIYTTSYFYKEYVLDIVYDFSTNLYKGECTEANVVLLNKSRVDLLKKFRDTIDNVESKEERIKRLEEQLASITTQLEEVKKEKDILTYKGVVLEYGVEDGLDKGYMIGRIRNAPKGTRKFYHKVVSNMQVDFEEYIDELEETAYLYNQIMGKEYK